MPAPERSDVDVRLLEHAFSRRGFLQRHHEAVFADGEADAGSRGTTERLGKSVIAAAAEDCILGAQRSVREFERGARVVIEAAHQAVVQGEGDADRGQNFFTASKCVRQASSRNWLMRGGFR
jgi:hypothetical protein